MLEKKLATILTARFEEEDLQDCYIVEVVRGKGNKVEVFVDSDGELTLNKCRIISRHLEKYIDEQGWLGEKYTLEVSSPGLDRPLRLVRQYEKNVGRNIRIKTDDDVEVVGVLTSFTDKGIIVVEQKKKKEIINHEFDYDQIREAKIQVSFKK